MNRIKKHTQIEKRASDLEYVVKDQYDGVKLLDVLFRGMNLSSRLIKRSKQSRSISLNGIAGISVNCHVKEGDVIRVSMADDSNHFLPEDIPIDVVYEDEDLLIINKSPFLVVHPTKGHPFGTVANGVAYYFENKGVFTKIRFINRLDRDTSGIMLVAKNGFSQQAISNQMKADLVKKKYLTIVTGNMENKSGRIELPIGRTSTDDIRRRVLEEDNGGQYALTLYEVKESFNGYDLLEVELITGRTHQIRVHLEALGHPIVGDELYGGGTDLINRQALHCKKMILAAPRDGVEIIAEAGLPRDIEDLIERLRLI